MFGKTILAALATFLLAGTAQAQFFCPPQHYGPVYHQPVYMAPADHIVIEGVYAPFRSRFDATIRYGSVWRKVPIINGLAPKVHVSRMSNGGTRTVYDYSGRISYKTCTVYGDKKPAATKPLPPREELDGFTPRRVPQRDDAQEPPKKELEIQFTPRKVPKVEREPELPLPPRQDLGIQPYEPVAPRGMAFPNEVPSSENVVRPTYEAPNK